MRHQTGLRFSRNAAIPSRKSAVSRESALASSASAMAASSHSLSCKAIRCLVVSSDCGLFVMSVFGQSVDALRKLFRRNHLVDEANAMRFRRINDAAGEEQISSVPSVYLQREKGRHKCGHKSDTRFSESEL